ncbi:MAG: insulinase family protein [Verrucomicrobiales bacterium]|jgi:predicted Zn-dependent peptidase|nr:insulinase family protein [Verrucomicrobiales bacterium]
MTSTKPWNCSVTSGAAPEPRAARPAPSADRGRATPGGAQATATPAAHQLTRLDNGITVATAAMPGMASVSLGLWIAVGGRYEPEPVSGVSHFIEHMLFKGTRRRSAEQISQDVEGIGGYLNAFTSEDHTCFYSKALKDRFDDLADVLFDMLLESRFSPVDIRREREVIREEVAMYLDQPQQHVQEVFNEIMWPGHALGRPLTGTFQSIDRIHRRTMVEFLGRHYNSASLVVAAAGALDHETVVKTIRRHTRRLPTSVRQSFDPYPTERTQPSVRLVTKSTEQSQIALGFRACSRTDPRRFAVRLLNIVLGENMSSRLFQLIREDRGLVYSIYSGPSFWSDVGDLVISAGLDAEKIEPVLRLVFRELRHLASSPVSRAELQRAHDYAVGQMDLSLENTENHMMWLGEQLITTGRLPSVDAARRELSRVTPADIRACAQAFLRPERAALAVVSPMRSDRPLRRLLGL